MTKYMVLYSAPEAASDMMKNATPEEMQAGMDSWMKWREIAEKTIKVDFGMPLEAVSHISAHGTSDSTSHVTGYATVEGESREAVIELLKSHPHLQRPNASLDVLEMLSMPGLDA